MLALVRHLLFLGDHGILTLQNLLAPADGTQMKIWQCYSGLAAQTWFYTGDDRIALENQGLFMHGLEQVLRADPMVPGKCLDLTNGSRNDGTVMQIWGCTNGNTNQVWTLS